VYTKQNNAKDVGLYSHKGKHNAPLVLRNSLSKIIISASYLPVREHIWPRYLACWFNFTLCRSCL